MALVTMKGNQGAEDGGTTALSSVSMCVNCMRQCIGELQYIGPKSIARLGYLSTRYSCYKLIYKDNNNYIYIYDRARYPGICYKRS
jgi:hypothetical protein